ncbi:MAG TPA: DUF488 family protein [Rhodocyclaceae bacterium]|nr:DUF488 family protein [Rhodocyclaceae bacterium]
MIELQRVYDHRKAHGTRFLVERLWPRGIRKDALHFSDWLKDAAPSDALRRWFQHDPAKWVEFKRRYRTELDEHPDAWAPIAAAARAGDVVLLYSSHDTEHNNAVVLRDYVNDRLDQRVDAASSRGVRDRDR